MNELTKKKKKLKVNLAANIVNNFFLDSDYQGKDWEAVRKELIKRIEKALKENTEQVIKEIKDYQHGWIRDDGTGEPERAPEWQVIEDLLKKLCQ